MEDKREDEAGAGKGEADRDCESSSGSGDAERETPLLAAPSSPAASASSASACSASRPAAGPPALRQPDDVVVQVVEAFRQELVRVLLAVACEAARTGRRWRPSASGCPARRGETPASAATDAPETGRRSRSAEAQAATPQWQGRRCPLQAEETQGS